MAAVKKSAIVKYSVTQMYDVVSDVEAYPEFVSHCVSATILSREENTIKASLGFSIGKIRHSFTTINTVEPDQSIEMNLLEGPFKFMRGVWLFRPLRESACEVSFDMEFEIKGRLLGKAFGQAFKKIADSQVDAFCSRAEKIYG